MVPFDPDAKDPAQPIVPIVEEPPIKTTVSNVLDVVMMKTPISASQ
jgi:hypothetical protein